MKPKHQFIHLSLCILTIVSVASAQQTSPRSSGASARRQVAVTFDDLPFTQDKGTTSVAEIRRQTSKLLAAITKHKIPAIGFVNEGKLNREGAVRANTDILRMWLDAGLELGNHTFSHPDLHTTPLETFKENVVQGEPVTRRLVKERGMKLRYFRHPFLHTGRDLETKLSFEKFLAERGYTVAPVTIDNSEWIFAAAYHNAAEQGDKQLMRRVASAYLPYMEQVFAYYEQQSIALLGYELKQILLLHANALNADYFDEIARMMKRRGYTFITLDEALTDKAYRLPDTFTGPGGITWLHRWALTQGKRGKFFEGEPTTPDFVMKLAGVTSQ